MSRKRSFEEARQLLVEEVSEYDDYLTGNVYGYIIEDKDGMHLDSCWGFVGDTKYMIEEAKHAAESEAKTLQNRLVQDAVEKNNQRLRFPLSDWQYEVSNETTQLGYDEWIRRRVEATEEKNATV